MVDAMMVTTEIHERVKMGMMTVVVAVVVVAAAVVVDFAVVSVPYAIVSSIAWLPLLGSDLPPTCSVLSGYVAMTFP